MGTVGVKCHDYFYSGETELRLSDLTMVRPKHNEHVHDYIRRFRDVKNRCFSLTIAEKDIADLAFLGLLAHVKDKLEGQEFLDVNQVLQKTLANTLWTFRRSSHRYFGDKLCAQPWTNLTSRHGRQ